MNTDDLKALCKSRAQALLSAFTPGRGGYDHLVAAALGAEYKANTQGKHDHPDARFPGMAVEVKKCDKPGGNAFFDRVLWHDQYFDAGTPLEFVVLLKFGTMLYCVPGPRMTEKMGPSRIAEAKAYRANRDPDDKVEDKVRVRKRDMGMLAIWGLDLANPEEERRA